MTHQPPLAPDMFGELCPSSLLPFRFGDKWAALVIRCLEDGPRRFSELRVLGRSMLEPLEAACAWAAEHGDELLDARER